MKLSFKNNSLISTIRDAAPVASLALGLHGLLGFLEVGGSQVGIDMNPRRLGRLLILETLALLGRRRLGKTGTHCDEGGR